MFVYIVFTKEINGFDAEIEAVYKNEDEAKNWVDEYNKEQKQLYEEIDKLKKEREKYSIGLSDNEGKMEKQIEINKKINKIAWLLSANPAWYEIEEVLE